MSIDEATAERLRHAVNVEGRSLYAAHCDLPKPRPSYAACARLLPDLVKRGVSRGAQQQIVGLEEALALVTAAREIVARLEGNVAIEISIDQSLRGIEHAERWLEDALVCVRVDHRVPEAISFKRVGRGIEKIARPKAA
jgi:hypothetical protein